MSSTVPQAPLNSPLHVPRSTFVGAIWGAVVFSFIFLAVRLYSRFAGPRRLFWDDGFIMFAWTLALLSAILWHFVTPYLYAFFEVTSGLYPAGPYFVLNTEQYYTGQLIVLIFFYTGLWSVKLSFLMFFKRLGKNANTRRYLWWAAFLATIATYAVCIGTIQYKCLARPLEEIVAHCSSDADIDFTLVTLKVNCSLDIITDVLIMIIPISLVWNIRIRWDKKLALIGIFSLVVVTISFAIVRVVVVSGLTRQPDVSWLYLWSSIEQNIACLSAFPQLFTNSQRTTNPVLIHSRRFNLIKSAKRRQPHGLYTTEMSTLPENSTDYVRVPEDGQSLMPSAITRAYHSV
ncbi:hypothetical protein NUW58_g46 [Xylaria curta]|uniref:Uncharacterized protein n=1 Tax=Xylaria curta TaxID=42375 RepID=A0ACC1PTL3_9PEZI|nr:hypothetical protein NUW58_g46 [Xylaria curta]